MSSSRGNERRHLLYYLEVVGRSATTTIGRLGDIHSEGLLLITPQALTAGQHLDVSIRIPAPLGLGRQAFDLGLVVRWSRVEGPGNQYLNGCSYDSIQEPDRIFIQALVKKIGFSDGQKKIVLKGDANRFIDTGSEE